MHETVVSQKLLITMVVFLFRSQQKVKLNLIEPTAHVKYLVVLGQLYFIIYPY